MNRQLLSRATDNSDAPTPGYMYLDIAKNAATNPATCSDIAKYLTGRLASKNNHNVKYKCLKIISKTCTSPYLRGQFKRCLSQDPQAMAAIKDALQFRGPPDPVRGDEPYERVRTAAREALDAVYSDTPQDMTTGAPFATSVSSSYGPSPHDQGSGYGGGQSYGGGPRRMEGIGNPMFKDPRLEPEPQGIGNMTINDVVKEAKETVIGIIKDPLARNVHVQVGPNTGSYHSGSYSGPPPGRNELMHQTNGQWTMASNRGPNAVPPPPNYSQDSNYYKSRENGNAYAWAQSGSAATSGGVGGSWASTPSQTQPSYQHQATPSISITGGSVVMHTSGGGTAVADGSYEKQLIIELCPPGGMKPEPPPDKLAQFSRSVSSLNADLVCPVLLDCLEEGQPWIIRAKALWVIESCIKFGQKPGAPSNPYTDFFHACSGEIVPLANHTRVAIRDPAKRVLKMLGVAVPVLGSAPLAASAPPAAPPPAPVPNLLDFSDDSPTPVGAAAVPAPTASPVAPAAPAMGNSSLFGGLNVAGPPTARNRSAPPQPPAAPASGNLLGDFMSSENPSSEAMANGGNSLFGDVTVKQNTTSQGSAVDSSLNQASSMFDNLSLVAEDPKKEELVSSMPSGSAFGFINQSSSTDTTEKKENTPSVQARDSFDPLKNMTPNAARSMMQFSPEQMQAMAYQQMLMQQQMQMAQMMAMQQRGGGMFMPMPGVVMKNPAASKASFAFMDKPTKKEDKSFDFVKDAMTMEKKK